MRRKMLSLLLGSTLAIAAVAPAAASNHQTVNQGAVQNALVGLIVQAAVRDVEVAVLNNSLNNLLQGADIDIDALNNSLNNVLQNVNVDISDIDILILSPDGDIVVSVLNGVVVAP